MKGNRERRKGASAADGAGPSEAPRVSRETTSLSVREQLAQLRASGPGTEIVRTRTKFRRKKGVAGRAGVIGGDAVPDGKYKVGVRPVVFIDGYNVIGAWKRLMKLRDRGDLQGARDRLVHDVTEFSYVRGWSCVVVFDAQGKELGTRVSVTAQNVEIVFTGGETADSYIERAIFEWCERGTRPVWAATNDVAQVLFSRAKGAHVMSASLFVQEIKLARRETRERAKERDEASVRAKMLICNVDESTREGLYKLRERLDNPQGG